MQKNLAKMIEDYQKLLARDPHSKAFAPLAEALREQKNYKEAESFAVAGIKRHPAYVGGYVALGRILMDQSRLKESGPILKKAVDLDPQNLLALQLYAQYLIQIEEPKEALKIFKRILFLNPQSEKARSAVSKLESLTADEFEEDTFQYQKINESSPKAAEEVQYIASPEIELDRKLSLADALIVRNELEKAQVLLNELLKKYPGRDDVIRRLSILVDSQVTEEATPIQPLESREKQVVERKVRILERILERALNAKDAQIVNLES
jgi:tetratricopeptide (TPR) repeat protein